MTGKTRLMGNSPDCLIPAPAGWNRTQAKPNGKNPRKSTKKSGGKWDPKERKRR